jgi:hypothetical protein
LRSKLAHKFQSAAEEAELHLKGEKSATSKHGDKQQEEVGEPSIKPGDYFVRPKRKILNSNNYNLHIEIRQELRQRVQNSVVRLLEKKWNLMTEIALSHAATIENNISQNTADDDVDDYGKERSALEQRMTQRPEQIYKSRSVVLLRCLKVQIKKNQSFRDYC